MSRPPGVPYALPDEMELPGRRGYDIDPPGVGLDDPEPEEHRYWCKCSACESERNNPPLHRMVRRDALSQTTACGLSIGIEGVGTSAAPRFALEPRDAVTCVKCLAASRLRLVKVEQP